MKSFVVPILFFLAILPSKAQNYVYWKSEDYVNNKFQNRSNWVGGQIPDNPYFNRGPAIIDFGNKISSSFEFKMGTTP